MTTAAWRASRDYRPRLSRRRPFINAAAAAGLSRGFFFFFFENHTLYEARVFIKNPLVTHERLKYPLADFDNQIFTTLWNMHEERFFLKNLLCNRRRVNHRTLEFDSRERVPPVYNGDTSKRKEKKRGRRRERKKKIYRTGMSRRLSILPASVYFSARLKTTAVYSTTAIYFSSLSR